MAVHFVAIVRAYLQLGAYARTTATATKTPENNDLIDWLRKNNRSARAAPVSFAAVLF